MKLAVTSLREGVNPVAEEMDPSRLGLDDEQFRDPVRVSGQAVWSGEHAQVQLTIEAPGHFVCDRCAEPAQRTITAETACIVLLEDPLDDVDDDEEDGEMAVIPIGTHGTVADLTDEIIAALELAIPLRMLCRDDCRGLCPVCYTNLNDETCEHAVDGETPIPESPASAGEPDSEDSAADDGFGDVATESIADKLRRQSNKKKNR